MHQEGEKKNGKQNATPTHQVVMNDLKINVKKVAASSQIKNESLPTTKQSKSEITSVQTSFRPY